MHPRDYQMLINRNWRRSGHYCYLPINSEICCPAFTIRQDSNNFKMNRSHKKIIKTVNKFLKTGDKQQIKSAATDGNRSNELEKGLVKPRNSKIDTKNIVDGTAKPSESIAAQEKPKKQENSMDLSSTPDTTSIAASVANPKPTKKKFIRLQRKIDKLAKKGLTLNDVKKRYPKTKEKTLEERLAEAPQNGKHKLRIELVSVDSSEMDKTIDESFEVYSLYEAGVHKKLNSKMKDFKNFLVDSPIHLIKNEDGPPCGYGSFHQRYYLDDKLIAVGVIDILPECVSSVYFFYNPEYNFLSLGTYGSLREVEFTRQLAQICPELKYYYLGFYIPNCPKMRYKANLNPSYLLCSEKFTWHLLDNVLKSEIDAVKYKRFNDADEQVDKMKEDYLKYVTILCNRTVYKFKDYRKIVGNLLPSERDEVMEYAERVGKTLACRMLLYRSISD